ncbi:protein kinase [Archangium violaceum]|uniref:protein kinase domain-containing protein n=1 Tax=Archangium violaceum TaxID=83451 RepID=UPI002B312DC9|nr:protein kinase [Archangium violaceum]
MSLESRLRAPDGCPDENLLAGFASGALSLSDTPEVERHLDGCAPCRELVAAVAAEDAGSSARGAPTRLDTGTPTLPMHPEAPVLGPGDTVGRYVLEGLLGQGGMGVVYAAKDPGLGRTVALKLLRPGVGGEEGRARLVREAQAMARLAHPNVLPLFELGTEGERVFLAMERVEGPTLADWLRERERPWREVLALFLQAGEGLAAAHRAGLVHRDFKPANVLVGADGRPRVTDFGLVRHGAEVNGGAPEGASGDTGEALSRAGAVPGTPAYMSPEQLAGREVDARGDQFSFCVALHEALYGVRPFEARERGVARWKRVPVPRGLRPPGYVRAAIERGLALEPEARFPSMDALLAALARPPGSRWGSVTVGVVGLGLVLAGADVLVWRTPREPSVVAAKLPEAVPLTLELGSRYEIKVPGVHRVAVGEPGIVDVRVVGAETLSFEPVGPGTTTLLVWTKDSTRRTYTVTVRPR